MAQQAQVPDTRLGPEMSLDSESQALMEQSQSVTASGRGTWQRRSMLAGAAVLSAGALVLAAGHSPQWSSRMAAHMIGKAELSLPDAPWIDCTKHAHSDLEENDVESVKGKTLDELIKYAGEKGYKGFAFADGVGYMKWSAGAAPFTAEDLTDLGPKKDVDFYVCTGDFLKTTHIVTTAAPTTTPKAVVVVDEINGRFVNGDAYSDLGHAGVLVHQWDNMEGTEDHQRMWMPCEQDWCAEFTDRFSTSLVNAQSPKQKGELTFFSADAGGFIVSPSVEVFCSYPGDGGSMSVQGETVKPGCMAEQCSAEMWWTCSFPPDQLGVMFDAYKKNAPRYNEVVVGTAGWDPLKSIEAFFYLAGKSGCGACNEECEKVKEQHKAFQAEFAVDAGRVPLLCVDTSNWEAPFSDVSYA